MERENTWGYTRLEGALKNLGYKVGRNTIKRILQEHGIDPAPGLPPFQIQRIESYCRQAEAFRAAKRDQTGRRTRAPA